MKRKQLQIDVDEKDRYETQSKKNRNENEIDIINVDNDELLAEEKMNIYLENDERQLEEFKIEDDEGDEENEDEMEKKNFVIPSSNNAFAESGIVQKIYLENFLCHQCLELSFSPNINFIYGRNGSGKSAILVALQTVLGARSRDTGRGSSLKSLIREGSRYAIIKIWIKNEGSDAYLPDIFPKSILVERLIKIIGGSDYKIFKTNPETLVFKGKEQLEKILDYFNIQVDNPCVLMNQDISREFLHSNDNSDKYKFFLKASQLDQMRVQLSDTKEKIEEMNNILLHKKKMLPSLEKKVDKAQHEYDDAQEIKNLETKLKIERSVYLWSYVTNVERSIVSAEKDYQKISTNYQKTLSKNQEYREQYQEIETENQKLRNILKEKNENNKQLMNQLNELQQHQKNVHKQLSNINNNIKNLKEQYQKIGERQNHIKNKIEEIQQESQRDWIEEENNRRIQLDELLSSLNNIRSQFKINSSQGKDAYHHFESSKNFFHESQLECNNLEREVSSIENQLLNLKKSQKEHIRVYFDKAVEINNEIKKNRRSFHVTPIGPLGAYLNIKDLDEWGYAVESHLEKKGLIRTYLVNDYHDYDLLMKCFNSCKVNHVQENITVIVFRQPNAVYPIHLDQNLPLIGHQIVINSDAVNYAWIYNQLIDTGSIEKWILCYSRDESIELLKKNHQMQGSILKNSSTVTVRGDTIAVSCFLLSLSSYLSFSAVYKLRKPVLTLNIDNQINQLTKQREEIQHSYQISMDKKKKLQQQYQTAQQQYEKNNRLQKKLTNDINVIEAEIKVIEEQQAENEKIKQADTSRLEEDIVNFENKKEEIKSLIEEKKSDLTPYSEQMKKIKNQIIQQEALIHENVESIDVTQEELQKLVETLTRAQVKLDLHDETVRAKLNELNEAKTILNQFSSDQDRYTQMAIEGSEDGIRTHDNLNQRSTDQIGRSLHAMEKRLEIEKNKVQQDIQILQENLFQHQRSQDEVKSVIRKSEIHITELEKNLKSRHKEWKRFRKTVALMATDYFQYYMTQRGHTGCIEFDHNSRTINFIVNTDGLNNEHPTTDTKSLSGGERSYTTLSFLMALAESMQTPFRAIDEFDIYMDSINRRISMRVIIDIASSAMNRQFIFITPLDVSSVVNLPHVKIHKMAPPERGQSVLNL